MIDVYRCLDAQAADRIMDLLRAEGMTPLLRDQGSTPFPTMVGAGGEQLLAVHTKDAERARSLIRAAVEDGVVPEDGEIIG